MVYASAAYGSIPYSGAGSQIDHSICVLIDGVQRGDYVPGSFSANEELNGRNTCRLKLKDKTQSYFPQPGEEILVLKSGQMLFRGTIDRPKVSAPIAGPVNDIDINAVDFNQLCDRFPVAKSYEAEGQTLKDIVTDVVNVQTQLHLEGVTLGGVQDGPLITKAVFNYFTVTRCFNDLSDLTGYYWYIDYNKVLHFLDRTHSRAPFSIGGSGKQNYRIATIDTTRQRYRNVQILRGGFQKTDPIVETLPTDGEQKTWTLRYPLANDATDPPIIKVDGVEQSVGNRGADDEDDYQFTYQHEEEEISQNFDDDAITAGQELEITYTGLIPLIVKAEDDEEIKDRADIEGGTGIYTIVEEDDDIDDRQLAVDRAEAFLRRYGTIPQIITIESDVFGLKAGHILSVTVPEYSIEKEFLIEKITIKDLGIEMVNGKQTNRLRFRITAVDGERFGSWVEFFSKLFEKKGFSVHQNELVTLLRKKREQVTLTDTIETSNDINDLGLEVEDPYTSFRMGQSTDLEYKNRMGFARMGEHPLQL